MLQTHPTNDFSLDASSDGSYVNVSFEFVGFRHGVELQVLHTGKSGSAIKLEGEIEGWGEPKEITTTSVGSYGGLVSHFFMTIVGLVTIASAFLFNSSSITTSSGQSHLFPTYIVASFIGVAILSFLSSILGVASWLKSRKYMFPDEFKEYEPIASRV